MSLRVAFQGERGAYSEEAVRACFGAAAEPVPYRENADVGRAVLAGEVDCGLLPIENSLAGSVVPTYDVLAAEDLVVVGEIVLPIHHCLLALPGTKLDGVRRVLSHPVALAQCRAFFQAHPDIAAVPWYDTAGAARSVAEAKDPADAALASRVAAEDYGLDILARNLEDREDNQTRFFILIRRGKPLPPLPAGGSPRTALLVDAADHAGALVGLLHPFANRGINLSKLESRPGEAPWSYRFFIEVDAPADDPEMRDALEAATRHASRMHVLGSFRRWMAEEKDRRP